MEAKFLLLLGVSGVGKSSIIRELRTIDPRFTYVSPYITRPLREGETDKIHVSDEALMQMEQNGDFVVVNNLYGVKYGTPRNIIVESLQASRFPILDWPIHQLSLMQKLFPLYVVYVLPPSIDELRKRLARDGRDSDGSRLMNAVAEVERFQKGEFDGVYDICVVSEQGKIPIISHQIYTHFMQKLAE